MKFLKTLYLIILYLGIYINSVPVANAAGIAFSNESVNSLSISSVRSENHAYHVLEISIDGISASEIHFKTSLQTLYLSARKGGQSSKDIITGAQVVNLAFNFPANADLKSFDRKNLKNKIIINVPKSQQHFSHLN